MLHTGDIKDIDSEGYLTIRGRKKDTFKTAKGKFAAPVPIENKLFEYSRVEMMCLIGLGFYQALSCLLYPMTSLTLIELVMKTTKRVIEKMNEQLLHTRRSSVLMIKEPWSIENGVLTPTLKIKRHILEQKYHEVGHGQKINWWFGKSNQRQKYT